MNRKINAPFIFATIVFTFMIIGASAQTVRPSQAASHWWLNLTEREQSIYLLGYKASAWAWANGLAEAQQFTTLTGPTIHVYKMLAPVIGYPYDELRTAITTYYQRNHTDTPIWQVIATYATDLKNYEGDL